MTTAEPEVVRLHGADGILSAVPAVLGFHPQDSIVVVGLVRTPHRDALRVGPVSRTDLDEFEKRTLQIATRVTASLIFCDVVQVYLVTYGRNTDTGLFSAALRGAGIGIAGILHVGNDAQPIDAHLKAATVALGMVIEDDRQTLVARVEHRKGARPITEVLDRLRTTTERDRYVAECIRDRDNALPLLLAACRGAMDDCLGDDTPPVEARVIVSNLLAVTAVIAYRQGSNPLADAALDRSLRIDPGNNLARILAVSIQVGMPPEYLDVLAESH